MSAGTNAALLFFALLVGAIIGFYMGSKVVAKELLFRLFWFNYLNLDDAENIAKALRESPTNSNCRSEHPIDIEKARKMMSGKG